MSQFNKINLLILLLLILVLSAYGQSSVYLKIQSEGFQPIKIVVSPFLTDIPTDISAQVRNIIMNDLTLSGFFTVIDRQAYPIGGTDGFTEPGENTFTNLAGAQLDARFGFQGEAFALSVNLIDLPARNNIFNQIYSASLTKMRWLAHEVADDVIYNLVGEPGNACTKIAFIVDQDTAKEVALIDYDGFGNQQLTTNGSINLSPCWSPNGKGLAFTHFRNNNPDLMLYYLAENRMIKGTQEKGLNTAPAWSPDGDEIALTLSRDGNAEIYTWKMKNKKLIRLTSHPAIDSSPAWSPNGRLIAFTSDRSGGPQIYLMEAEGGNVRRLTYSGSYNDSPSWSPKGDKIAFVSRIDGFFQIFTIDVNGQNLQQLTEGRSNNEDPSWAPHGFKMAFAADRDGNWNSYVINWDGTQIRQVTQTGGNRSPAWSPRLTRKR